MDNRNTIIRLDDPSFEWKEEDRPVADATDVVTSGTADRPVYTPAADAPVPVDHAAAEAAAGAASGMTAAAAGGQIPVPETETRVEPAFTPAADAPFGTAEQASGVIPPNEDTAAGDWVPAHAIPDGPSHAKKEREKKYVTRGVLVTFMIVTMVVSAILGAVAGVLFSRTGSGQIKQRVDSELSQLNLSDATGSEMTVAEIVQKNEDSVVEIVVEGTAQGMWGQLQLVQGAGSGVIVREDGYIATNYHVIQGANKVEVTLHNGDTYPAKIIGSDAANDIAVIKIDAKELVPVTIGDSSTVHVGDLAVAIGNPLGQLGGTATTGIISALDRTLTIEGTTLTLIQTDAAINGGNSGGGLFNSKGELIGIVESKASAVGVEGLAFALPINSVSEIINDFIENGGSGQASKATPAVGVVISEVSEENAQYYGLSSAGVYIAQVTGENAQKAGFQEKDRIVSIDGKDISSSNEFISIVRKHKVGDTVTIVVERNGQQIEIKTELQDLDSTSSSGSGGQSAPDDQGMPDGQGMPDEPILP